MALREGWEREYFTLTADHVKLLRAANVSWGHMEWGAPCIDGKRPYGNGDVHADIARLLGIEYNPDEDDEDLATRDRLWAIHLETELALGVVLRAGTFEPGRYVADRYFRNWQRL